MRKNKLLAAIIVATIFLQLFAYVNFVRGDALPVQSAARSPSQNTGFADSFALFKKWDCDFNWFFDWWGCHHSGGHGHYPFPYITVSPQSATIAAGQTQTYSAFEHLQNGHTLDVSTNPLTVWSINSGDGTFSWTGNTVNVTAAGNWVVTVTYKWMSDTASLNVTHAGIDKLDRLTASVNPSIIEAPNTAEGTATAYDVYGNGWDVSTLATWSIPAGEDGGSWNSNVYTSHKAGTYTVQAAYGGKTATASLTVTHATGLVYLDHIAASLNPIAVATPGTVTGTATAYDSFGNSWDVSTLASWSIPSGGDGGSWFQNVYTSHAAGTYTVQAAYEGKTATAQLTVTPATNEVDHIAISPKTATVSAGVSENYTATAYDVYGNSWSVTAVYSCTNSSVIISGNSAYSNETGTYTITGTYNGKSDTATLTVVGHLPGIISISVAPKQSSIAAGNSQSYTATATDGYNTWDVTGSVSWSIDSAAGGSWSGATYTSANAGTWTVKATLGSLSDTATLTVTANSALLKSIVVSPKTATVPAGTAQAYTTTAYDQFGNSLGDVTSLTTFSAPGASVTRNSVKSDTAGTYTVTATYHGLTDTATLTVTGSTETQATSTYAVTFTENGLPSGTTWTITFQGQEYSSASTTLTINDLSPQSYSWSTLSIQSGRTRYLPTQASGSLSVPNQLTQTIDYSTLYLVTYSVTGNATYVSVPSNEWVNLGGQPTGVFPTQVTDAAQNTRCNFLGDNRTSSITEPTTISGKYQTQYSVVFNASGIQSDAKGTIVTVSGVSENYTQLAACMWVNNGTELTFNFATTVQSTNSNKIYSLTSVNASSPVLVEKPSTIQGNYKSQNSVTLYTVLLIALLTFSLLLTAALLLRYRRDRIKRERSINQNR